MFYTYDMKKTIFSPCYILRTNILFMASLNAGSGVFWMENSSKRQVLLCKKKLFSILWKRRNFYNQKLVVWFWKTLNWNLPFVCILNNVDRFQLEPCFEQEAPPKKFVNFLRLLFSLLLCIPRSIIGPWMCWKHELTKRWIQSLRLWMAQ